MRGAGKPALQKQWMLLTLAMPAMAGAVCERPVYLTFDTGHMGVAPLIAEVLQRQQVRVTFFAAHEKTREGDGSPASTGLLGGARAPRKGMNLPATPTTMPIGAAISLRAVFASAPAAVRSLARTCAGALKNTAPTSTRLRTACSN